MNNNELLQQALNNDPIMHQLLIKKIKNNEPIIIEGIDVCNIVNRNVFEKIDPILNDIIKVLADIIKLINNNVLKPIDDFFAILISSLNKAIKLLNVFISFVIIVINSLYKLVYNMWSMKLKMLKGDFKSVIFFYTLPQLLFMKQVLDTILMKFLPPKYANININNVWAIVLYILYIPIVGALYNILNLFL